MLTIEVTQANIDDANRYQILRGVAARRCPIALGAQDAGLHAPHITHDMVSYEDAEGTLRYAMLPPVAQRFIVAYDSAEHVEPFCFHVDLGVAA